MSVIDRVPIADQIAEVKREIEMRKRTYIRMIDAEKMTAAEAEKRTLNMCAVLHTLEQLQEGMRNLSVAINMINMGLDSEREAHHDDDAADATKH